MSAEPVRVTFGDTLRGRPLVLTRWEVWALSDLVGRDVLPELQSVCGEHYAVKTLGQLMRTLGAILQGGRQHIPRADCWCSPRVEFTDPASGANVWVHQRVQ